MKLVIDASVALKWVLDPLDEPGADDAGKLLRHLRGSQGLLVAPTHWFAEIVAVVVRKEPGRVDDTIALLHTLNVDVVDGPVLLARAAKLSALLDHHLFDTLYHAVAIDRDATLVTADQRYFAKAAALGHIELLGSEAIK